MLLCVVTEKELIKRCSKQDRLAQQRLYETYSSKMLGVCIRYVSDRETAMDVMHDGFITVFAKIGDFRGEGSFEGWMRRIFVTTALGHLRKRNALTYAAPVEEVVDITNHEASVIERMEARELLKCVDALPEGYRVVLNLFAIEGYAHREIAEMLNITESTSRSQYFRAKATLCKMLEEAEII